MTSIITYAKDKIAEALVKIEGHDSKTAARIADEVIDEIMDDKEASHELLNSRKEEITVLIKTDTAYIDGYDDQWDGVHVIFLEDCKGNTYFTASDGISDILPFGRKDGVILEDVHYDVVVAKDKFLGCLEEADFDAEWKTVQGERICYVRQSGTDQDYFFIVVHNQHIGDMLQTPVFVVENYEEDVTADEVKELLSEAAKEDPERFFFGEFGIPWANFYVVRFDEAPAEVQAKVDEVYESIDIEELREIVEEE